MRKASSTLLRRGQAFCRVAGRRSLSVSSESPSVQITTLPNKIRVATEATPGHFSSVGLYIDAGSRYESAENSGVSHFLDRMAFKVYIILLMVIVPSESLLDNSFEVR